MRFTVAALRVLLCAIAGSSAVRRKKALKKETEESKAASQSWPESLVQSESTDTGKEAANATQAYWVTIGDSYSSGAGIHTRHADYEGGMGGCYRDWETVPGAIYSRANNMQFINKACAAAKIENIHPYIDRLANEYPEETANKWEGAIYNINAGGNNLLTARGERWEPLLLRCVLTLTACGEYEENQVNNFDEVEADLTELYTRLAAFASKAKIRVVGYPRLLQFNGWCWAVPGLTGAEAVWMDRMVDTFNSHISASVDAAKLANPDVDIQFVSIEEHVTVGACGINKRQISGVVLSCSEGCIPSPSTLHPSQRGYDAVLRAIENTL